MYTSYDERTYCTPVLCGKKQTLGYEFHVCFLYTTSVFFALPVYYLNGIFTAYLESFWS